MTPVEKWNSVSSIVDLTIALLLLGCGVAFMASQKKIAAGMAARAARGELSAEDAAKQSRLIHRCSYVLAGCGAALLVAWALGY